MPSKGTEGVGHHKLNRVFEELGLHYREHEAPAKVLSTVAEKEEKEKEKEKEKEEDDKGASACVLTRNRTAEAEAKKRKNKGKEKTVTKKRKVGTGSASAAHESDGDTSSEAGRFGDDVEQPLPKVTDAVDSCMDVDLMASVVAGSGEGASAPVIQKDFLIRPFDESTSSSSSDGGVGDSDDAEPSEDDASSKEAANAVKLGRAEDSDADSADAAPRSSSKAHDEKQTEEKMEEVAAAKNILCLNAIEQMRSDGAQPSAYRPAPLGLGGSEKKASTEQEGPSTAAPATSGHTLVPHEGNDILSGWSETLEKVNQVTGG